MTTLIEFNAVVAAAERLAGKVIRTPTIAGSRLAEKIQRPVFLKLENTQLGGSFKARGVLNKFLSLKGDFNETRFVAVSGGNFGIAIAEAAKIFGANVTIIMPPTRRRPLSTGSVTWAVPSSSNPMSTRHLSAPKLWLKRDMSSSTTATIR
ncbi:L-threonine dehydratase catabolic TdcB [Serratia plymuthica]|uniref:L-threonine dehydratase catabolic TdcB n=1 Tax=Serratia plymuthica TaxID=82996 RepID=A0A2X4UB65_SERPL|nr:L-threonine dehydratase catabolic TdcB [Serratia plymuthica]